MKAFKFFYLGAEGTARMNVQVAVGVRNARDLRSLLLDAAYALNKVDHEFFCCLLFKCGFSAPRLAQEIAEFKAVLHGSVGSRIFVQAIKSPTDIAQALPPGVTVPNLEELEVAVSEALFGKPRMATRETVVQILLYRWIRNMPPVKPPELAALSGASLPTVYAALNAIDPKLLQRDEQRHLSLTGFSAEAWQQWLTVSTGTITANFVDRSGTPRSPQKLVRLLNKLGIQGVAVGGVLGAQHYYPELDITDAPHLDLVVHGNQHSDLAFMTQIDPALERDDSKKSTAHVVVHFANRPHSLFEAQAGVLWANVLDCMVHMWGSNLIHQVENLISNIAPGGLRGPVGDRHG